MDVTSSAARTTSATGGPGSQNQTSACSLSIAQRLISTHVPPNKCFLLLVSPTLIIFFCPLLTLITYYFIIKLFYFPHYPGHSPTGCPTISVSTLIAYICHMLMDSKILVSCQNSCAAEWRFSLPHSPRFAWGMIKQFINKIIGNQCKERAEKYYESGAD